MITGVNTISCVLATTTAANVRDYAVIVVQDCVETMDGAALHEAGLLCIKTAFGFVLDTAEAARRSCIGGQERRLEAAMESRVRVCSSRFVFDPDFRNDAD